MTSGGRSVSCPRCGKPVRWGPESPFRPFCSERCKVIDLGAWANEEYRVEVKGADGDPDSSTGEAEPPSPAR